jgi:AraC-like DNA-binding protein
MNLFAVFTVIGIVQCLFYGIALVTKGGKPNRANVTLALLLFCIGLSVFPIIFIRIPKSPALGFFLRHFPDIRFLFGPLLLLYVRALAGIGSGGFRRYFIHFLPYCINAVFSSFSQFFQYGTWLAIDAVFSFACYGLLFAYTFVAIAEIRHHLDVVKNRFSSIKNVNLGWLRYLILSFIAIFAFMTVLEILHYAGFEGGLIDARDEIIALLVALFTFSLGFLGLRQANVFSGEDAAKYDGSSLTAELCAAFYERLLEYMDGEKPFLDSALTVEKLARKCRIPSYHLSRVINEKAGMIFYDFINSYRVKDVTRRLDDPGNDRFTILALAFDAGFNSKSAFYAAFKRVTGSTPSRYRKAAMNKAGDGSGPLRRI